MTDQPLPMFDEPPADTPTPPKKPKPKPTRRKRKAAHIAATKPIKRRKRRATKAKPVAPILIESRPKEFDVVQGLIKTMLLLDRTTAKSVANLLGSIFT
jgi:hypothetical protein